jgi:hypothetical protein
MADVDPQQTGSKPEPRLEPQAHGGALLRSAGPGRPKGVPADVQAYIRAHLFADQAQDRIGIIDVLLQQARRGNIRAIELSLWYGIGKPTETIDLTVKVREAATRLAEELGIDDSLIQSQVDSLVGR